MLLHAALLHESLKIPKGLEVGDVGEPISCFQLQF